MTAEGIAVTGIGRNTLALVRENVTDLLLAGEMELERAVSLLLNVEKTLVEGAGAAGLAAILQYPERFRGRTVGERTAADWVVMIVALGGWGALFFYLMRLDRRVRELEKP